MILGFHYKRIIINQMDDEFQMIISSQDYKDLQKKYQASRRKNDENHSALQQINHQLNQANELIRDLRLKLTSKEGLLKALSEKSIRLSELVIEMDDEIYCFMQQQAKNEAKIQQLQNSIQTLQNKNKVEVIKDQRKQFFGNCDLQASLLQPVSRNKDQKQKYIQQLEMELKNMASKEVGNSKKLADKDKALLEMKKQDQQNCISNEKLKSCLSRSTLQLQSIQKQQRKLREQNERLAQENDYLKEKAGEREQAYGKLSEDILQVKKALQKQQNHSEKQNQELNNTNYIIKKLEGELSSTKEQLMSREQEIDNHMDAVKKFKEEYRLMASQLTTKQDQIKVLRKQLVHTQRKRLQQGQLIEQNLSLSAQEREKVDYQKLKKTQQELQKLVTQMQMLKIQKIKSQKLAKEQLKEAKEVVKDLTNQNHVLHLKLSKINQSRDILAAQLASISASQGDIRLKKQKSTSKGNMEMIIANFEDILIDIVNTNRQKNQNKAKKWEQAKQVTMKNIEKAYENLFQVIFQKKPKKSRSFLNFFI